MKHAFIAVGIIDLRTRDRAPRDIAGARKVGFFAKG